jgi:hypothetical protein
MRRLATRALFLAILAMAVFALSASAQAPESSFLDAWRPLLGRWQAAGSGAPGSSAGEFSFTSELDGRVIVRRNRSESPAAGEGAAPRVMRT